MGFFKEYREVNELLRSKHGIVFYAESRHYHQYFDKLIKDLLASGKQIIYLTSDAKDPLLQISFSGMKVIYVKYMLGTLFSRLRADVMIMTMPDLGHFLFKRSPTVGRYIYVFHAAVSTHQQYRENAFFNYDAIFCAGSYQVEELRAAEQLYNLPKKELIPYGYPLINSIRTKIRNTGTGDNQVKTILIAPSWFPGCIFDTCIKELCQSLSSSSWRIIVRSHPEYEKRRKNDFKQLRQLISHYPDISIDTEPDVTTRLFDTDFLITDRSGIAFEFALGIGRPVLFIDTDLKEMNKEWRKLGIEPIENSLRDQLGVAILPRDVNQAPEKLALLESDQGFRERMNILEQSLFFHSYQEGPGFISSYLPLADQTSSR
jgi:YidC/Oxa1 family membrane protein insertase